MTDASLRSAHRVQHHVSLRAGVGLVLSAMRVIWLPSEDDVASIVFSRKRI